MSKWDSIITIVSLLFNRRSVSLKLIMEECQISRATTFRYLRSISEANFPIVYDPELRGYVLTNKKCLNISNLNSDEASIVVHGLELCEKEAGNQIIDITRRVRLKLGGVLHDDTPSEHRLNGTKPQSGT